MEILSFFLGIAGFYTYLPYALLCLFIALFFKAEKKIILWFIAGLFWSLIHHLWIIHNGLPDAKVIEGYARGMVTSIPIITPHKTQFEFHIQTLNNKPVSSKILLACYQHCPLFNANETWELYVKLKKPQALHNPGSFDYKTYLSAHHIYWTGYIKQIQQQLPTTQHHLLSIREQLANKLSNPSLNQDSLGITQALALGVTNHISPTLWELFRHTGTTHLMVISGAHIGLIASLAYMLAQFIWKRTYRLCLYRPAPQIGAICGLSIASLYALLAGFAIPAQRALIACAVVSSRHFLSTRFTPWQAWRYALFIVLIIEPHATLLAGFYLSFIAVATLIVSSQRIPYHGVKHLLLLQLACLMSLLPLSLHWFSYGAINGFIANLIAIPLVGYLIVPLSLLCLTLSQFCNVSYLFMALNTLITCLLHYLNWVDTFSIINIQLPMPALLSSIALMTGLFFTIFLPIRAVIPAAVALLITASLPDSFRIKTGHAQIDILDVGQGLSIVVNTAHHTLIYDTGMAFYGGSDMGKLVIIPYLQIHGIHKIDTVVISHPDLDHRGGLVSLEKNYPIGQLLVNNVAFYQHGASCHTSPDWNWDGITFHFFPVKKIVNDENNTSCILQISTEHEKMLLTGDIERTGERYLLNTYGHALKSDTLVVAHHGSKTSSHAAFIDEVAPHLAIISAGADNRYHFPHQQTLNTFNARKITYLNTATAGMIRVLLQ